MTELINLDFFKKIYNNDIDDIEIDEKIVDKIRNIKDIIDKDVYVKPQNKTFIKHVSAFNCRFREEDTKKKTVISFLNKLTNANIDLIIPKLENNICEPYTQDILNVINFIKCDKKNLKNYIKVLKIFPDNEVINNLDNFYNNNKEYWLTDSFYIENKVYSTACSEEIYSNFLKWKDGQLVFTELLLFYKDIDMITNIVNNILNYIENNKSNLKREIIDPLLEHLNILNQLVSYEELDKLLLLDNLSSSTKFKINDIKNKKMKS